MFVDDYEFGAYKAAGFSKSLKIGLDVPEGFSLQAPSLGFGEWWKYLSNVIKVSPMPSESVTDEQVLAVVSKLGGTLVVDGEDVIYQWTDSIPGDHPDLEDILQVVRNS